MHFFGLISYSCSTIEGAKNIQLFSTSLLAHRGLIWTPICESCPRIWWTFIPRITSKTSIRLHSAGEKKDETVLIHKLAVWWGIRQNMWNSGVPRNFFSGGVSTSSVEDRGQRELGSGGGSPLGRGSGGSCNLVQEISFHMVKFS